MKQFAKALLRRAAPRWTTALMSARARAHSQRVIAGWGNAAVARRLVERYGSAVQEGPFAGTALGPMAHAEQLGPYLLGVYESELDGAWEVVLRGAYEQVIDIGAKFGYYAVGLARRYPAAKVLAFDTDPWARRAVREMAAANGATNVAALGFCGPEWLAANARAAALVVSDCEGYEAELFSPAVLPSLAAAVLVIETHDCFAPGVSARLKAALAATHEVRVFGEASGRRETTRPLDFLTPEQRRLATREVRPPQEWLLCLPRAGPNAHLVAGG